MRKRFKSILYFIFLLFIVCLSLGVGYIFYDKISSDSDIVVDGKITINYLNGKKFNLSGNNEITFSVTNNDSEAKYYYIQLTDVYANDVSYELISSDNLNITNNLKSEIVSNQVSINGNETINYTLKFKVNGNEKYSGTIQIGLKENEKNTFADVILANNKVNEKSLTGIGESAILDEGLLKKEDDHGVAYYFRGNVKNNNVLFADKNWKIVKINGDGSIKLVLDGVIDELSKYYEEDYSFSNSTIYKNLEKWYTNTLDSYGDYIAYYKYCNDYVLDDDNYLAYNRVITNKIPTYVCLGNLVNSRIGLLTVDEVSLAGGSTSENKNFYLYNEKITGAYYTMSGAMTRYSNYYPFAVDSTGAITSNINGTLLRSIRPVITIIKTAKVTGTGTSEDPYKLIMK